MAKRQKPEHGANDLHSQDGRIVVRGNVSADDARFARRYLRRSLEVFLYWMPVWVPLILLAQIGTRGLKPSRLEEQRLGGHERELEGRLDADMQEAESLQRQIEALHDDIYLERLRRQRAAEQQREVDERGLTPKPPITDAGENDGGANG